MSVKKWSYNFNDLYYFYLFFIVRKRQDYFFLKIIKNESAKKTVN